MYRRVMWVGRSGRGEGPGVQRRVWLSFIFCSGVDLSIEGC